MYSVNLGREAMAMQERGDASVAGAGQYSKKLGREALTMEERRDASANSVAKMRFLAEPWGGPHLVWLT